MDSMWAVRLHPNANRSDPYSATNPAPASALILDSGIPIPQPLKPGELLVKIKATTIIRDALTWPETYTEDYKILGNDFAGTVVLTSTASQDSVFKPGDQVYGMTDAARAGTWAEYAIVTEEEAYLKPTQLTWAESAAVPLSALTAYQALFDKAGIEPPDFSQKQKLRDPSGRPGTGSILITGASGGVGLYLVQLAKLTDMNVVAATRSKSRTRDILKKLGADEVVDYEDLASKQNRFQVVIDTVGGDVLQNCWSFVKEMGVIVGIESSSYNFVEEHRNLGLSSGYENVKAVFFIVWPSQQHLKQLSAALDIGLIKPYVASTMNLEDVQAAYTQSLCLPTTQGKIVLIV